MTEPNQTLARRTWLVGGATAGAAAAAAVLLPSATKPSVQAASATAATPAAEPGGYRLTEHVKQYYASARV